MPGTCIPIVVAINQFSADTSEEITAVREAALEYGVKAIDASHRAGGGN